MPTTAGGFAQQAPLGPGVGVIQEDPNGLVALAKPAGVLSHPNRPGEESRALLKTAYTLAEECYTWQTAADTTERVWLLNRLDSATSGIVLLARDPALAQSIRRHFKQRRVRKIYAALVFGRPRTQREVWRDRLAVHKQAGKIRTDTRAGNIPAEAAMHLIQTNAQAIPGISLIQLEPRTGRSHQLRVQCTKRQLPIVGDATYGEFKLNRSFAKGTGEKRLFLHSFRTEFSYDWGGQSHRFSAEAPLPHAFSKALTSGT